MADLQMQDATSLQADEIILKQDCSGGSQITEELNLAYEL